MTLGSKAADYLRAVVKAQSTGDSGLWTVIKEKYDLGMELRRPFEQRWIISLAFLNGRQYTFFNSTAHLLQQLKKVPGRIRNVDNQLLPKWRRMVADLIKNDPIMSVVPATSEEEDIRAAKSGDKVLKGWWQGAKMNKKLRQLAGWIFACGNGFLDDRWNTKLGPSEVDEKTGDIVYAGDADCGVWNPFEVLVPFTTMGATDIHGFPWILKVKWRDLSWIAANYAKGKMVVNEQMPGVMVDTGFIMGGPSGIVASGKVEGALLMELYVKPNAEYKKGLFLTGANGILLQKAEYPFLKYNLEQFKDIDVPGIFWGKATLEDAIGLQKTWNRTLSSIDEYNRIMAKGKFLNPRGSKMEVQPDDTHGEVIDYTPVMGHKPEQMNQKALPPSMEGMLTSVQYSLDNLFSQHEISRGTNKSDIRSGEMVALLREQDAHGNIPTHTIFEESLECVMGRILKRIQKGYTSERMVKVIGRDQEFEVFAFQGSDLRNNTDVYVRRQSSLPDSRIARQGIIMERLEKGFYGNPQDPKVLRFVSKLLDEVPPEGMFSEMEADEKVAKWENEVLMSPQQRVYLINNYDNHMIHLERHQLHRKGLDFQKIKLQDPQMFAQLELKFFEHEQIHQKFAQEQREQMIKEQAMLAGKEAA
uniref:Portal protein n=1 Tax=viral metagenome TaxID=1070528 RepID=A0A6M3LMY7_9ZZZZ